jgi:hypothetical protein
MNWVAHLRKPAVALVADAGALVGGVRPLTVSSGKVIRPCW